MRRRHKKLLKRSPKAYSEAIAHEVEEDCLLEILRRGKKAIGWKISDLKGINPLICTHHIYRKKKLSQSSTLEKVESSHARGGAS
ncbi:hypothetical protein CK203_044679 [Vitis vinifera]|uniref:Uncharacterized protein n=1 Tax=Vitis vinifera TaxID=29760 RepID=A0A438H9J8_VITVI|nr:hypothetical protein CK203_044679 [Vitis vinifera]